MAFTMPGAMRPFEILQSDLRDPPLGAVADADGVHFSVFSAHADHIDVCLFDHTGLQTQSLPLAARAGGIWSGYIPGLNAGALYGYRAAGPHVPEHGHVFNPAKLLIDPYARNLAGEVVPNPALNIFNESDSAAFVPKCIVPAPPAEEAGYFDWSDDCSPGHAFSDTIIYEAHVRGLTKNHPKIPESLRGTFEALATDLMIEHFLSLGITALELMPIHSFADEPMLRERGLHNYWGYNTLNFFTPHAPYLGPGGVDGLKAAIRTLHRNGIEVILDVVFNHTSEGEPDGPTVCYRGLDNATYYHQDPAHPGSYLNYTGCGNTLNLSNPIAARLVLDSLRYWVETFHIDGFRFDLAPSLCRTEHGLDLDTGFFSRLAQDPVVGRTKLIVEPWDIGPDGYALGRFPPAYAEWNDRYRDDVRRAWTGERGRLPDLARAVMGSADIFDRHGREPWSSVNFICAHDGFTLKDLVSYSHKHNEGNLEQNRDGHDHNFSSNCGVDGPSSDPDVNSARFRKRCNLLATLLLSQGTPMVLAGDEVGNTQQGNNNAYCQDNPIGWISWSEAEPEILAFAQRLIALRRAHPVLRQNTFLHGEARPSDDEPTVSWLAFAGDSLDWTDPDFTRIAVRLRSPQTDFGTPDDDLILVFNTGENEGYVALPELADNSCWEVQLTTADPEAKPRRVTGSDLSIPGTCVVVVAHTGHST